MVRTTSRACDINRDHSGAIFVLRADLVSAEVLDLLTHAPTRFFMASRLVRRAIRRARVLNDAPGNLRSRARHRSCGSKHRCSAPGSNSSTGLEDS